MKQRAKQLNADIYNITYNKLFNELAIVITRNEFYKRKLGHLPTFRAMRNVDMEQLSNLYIGSYNA